jgi:hypothetical protein
VQPVVERIRALLFVERKGLHPPPLVGQMRVALSNRMLSRFSFLETAKT